MSFDEILPALEKKLILSASNPSQLDSLAKEMNEAFLSINKQMARSAFTTEQLSRFDEQAARIKHIAEYFKFLDNERCLLLEKVENEAHNLISVDRAIRPETESVDPKVERPGNDTTRLNNFQETLNSKILRRWFLDNVANPFPDRKTKEELIAKTNALVEAALPAKKSTAKSTPHSKSLNGQPIDYTQCSLWFVNSRRRSRWTDFFREFARQDKVKMRHLVECLKREEGVDNPGRNRELESLLRWGFSSRTSISSGSTTPEAEEDEMATRIQACRENFTTVMDWINQVTREKVGDWMDEVIREAKKEFKVEKAENLEKMKRRAEELKEMHQERDHHRQKMTETRQILRSADANIRQTDRTLRRRTAQRKERANHRRGPASCQTPDTIAKPKGSKESTAGDSSIGSISWTSSGSSQHASSLFESNVHPSSSSSSSLASYDAFVRVPASPTLSILRNSQPKLTTKATLQPVKVEATTPPTMTATLYFSDLASYHRLDVMSDARTRHPSASPAAVHLETALSGGAHSQHLSQTVSQPSFKSSNVNPFKPWDKC